MELQLILQKQVGVRNNSRELAEQKSEDNKRIKTESIKMDIVKKIINIKQQMMNGIASLDISVVKHCNLNCRGCDHFAPIADEWYIDIDVFESNLIRLKYILKDKKLYELNLMGGEPFLHDKLKQLCVIARKIFSDTKIVVVTNGIIYNKDKDAWDDFFNQYNIVVSVSDYSDEDKKFYQLNLSRSKSKFNNSYISCVNRCMDFNIIKNNDDKINFSLVPCAQLNDNGDLFSCIVPANIDIINEYFDCNFVPIEWEDYINIYKVDNADRIITMNNNKKIPFCEYCLRKTIQQWGSSSKDEKEWIKQ